MSDWRDKDPGGSWDDIRKRAEEDAAECAVAAREKEGGE